MKITKQEWQSYFENYPYAHILQSAEWGELKSEFGWKPEFVKTNEAGAMILFRKIPLGFSIAYIPEGPLGNPDDDFWLFVDEVCREQKAIFLKVEPFVWKENNQQLNLPTDFSSVSDSIQPPRTLVVDLSVEEDGILARMKQKTRYNIRLATKKGIEVTVSKDLSVFNDLMRITGNRDAFGVHSESYYQKVYELFNTVGKCELLIASFEGQPLAGVMVFTHGKNAWYLYGASSNEHRSKMPTYLVQWEAMKYAKSLGCETYDLYGVPDVELEILEENFVKKHEGLWGVYRFKRGFGGDLKRTVGAFDRVYLKILYKVYGFVRGLRS